MSDQHVNNSTGFGHKLGPVLRDADEAEARRLLQVWHVLGDEPLEGYPADEDVARARRVVLAATEREPTLERRRDRAPRRLRTRRHRVPWPAAIVLVAAVLLTWWLMPITAYAPPGERDTVDLADGTRVHLNSGATVRYRRAFGRLGASRNVELHGEAFFDVRSGEKPFVVETFNADVTAVGTRFNVRAWTDLEASTFVTVESGRVRVAPRSGARESESVVLSAGERVRIALGEVDSVSVSVADALAWRQGDLVYKARMLGVILDDVERRFGLAIRLDADVAETTRYSVALRDHPDAESVVRDLAGAIGLQYRPRSDGFELYRP